MAAVVNHTVGLKRDGTVVTEGYTQNNYLWDYVSDWTDIVQVAAGRNNTVGLKSDGTVVVAGYNSGIGDWGNIVQVATGDYHTDQLETRRAGIGCGRQPRSAVQRRVAGPVLSSRRR